MSYGDVRIWRGEVTSYWGWELSVDDNLESGRKIGGWASSRERAFSDAMTQLRLDAVRLGLHLDGDRTPPPLESRHRLNSALNELEAAERSITALRSELATMRITLPCDDDCTHVPTCPRWPGHARANCQSDDPRDADYYSVLRDETGAPMEGPA